MYDKPVWRKRLQLDSFFCANVLSALIFCNILIPRSPGMCWSTWATRSWKRLESTPLDIGIKSWRQWKKNYPAYQNWVSCSVVLARVHINKETSQDSVGVNHSFLILYSFVSGGGPFTFSNQQGTVVHDLSVDDKDYISVAEEVIK